jgi:5,6-dimethylbenzimidazole synthase
MTERFADLIDRTFSATEREIIYRLIRSRRDIRQFAPDPIPPETLLRILEAAHHGPSVASCNPGISCSSPHPTCEPKSQGFSKRSTKEQPIGSWIKPVNANSCIVVSSLRLESPMNIAVT